LNAIENANLNAETMAAMKQGAQALRDIHGNLYVDTPYKLTLIQPQTFIPM
jgi:hypothetical protein